MKLHKSLFATFLVMLMTIFSCSEESVLTANAEREIGNADDSEIKLTVEIAAPITRTVRPEIVKYTVELQIETSNGESESKNYETVISRTLNAHNTSTTFTNISIADYAVVVSGYDKNDNKILEGTSNISKDSFGSSNLLSQVEVTDYFDKSASGKGGITFNLYGLEDFYNTNITMKLTKAGSSGNNSSGNNDGTISTENNDVNLAYNEQTKIFFGTNNDVSSGSYIITCGNDLGFNLVQDPLVNIYTGATTEINWTFNYNKNDVSSDTTLKNIKIPVWKVPVNEDNNSAEAINAAGYISANALFAEPTFIGAGKYVSSAYDSDNNLWILTLDNNGTYKITNINKYDSASVEKQKFTYSLKFNGSTSPSLKDFTFTQVDGSEKTLFLAKLTGDDGNKTVSIYSLDKTGISDNVTVNTSYNVSITGIGTLSSYNFTAVTTNSNDVYIAATISNNFTTVGVYKGDLSSVSQGTITFSELTVATNSSEENKLGKDLVSKFSSFTIPTCFRVTDMYFDDSVLYITAGALCLNFPNENSKISSSFGGLFKYTVNSNNVTHSGDTGAAGKMVKSEYYDVLSVPRCIVPVENALYIVDSGFCGTVDETTSSMNVIGKCNRICVINDKNKLGEFKITDLHDSADFDFSVIMNAFNTNGYCWSF